MNFWKIFTFIIILVLTLQYPAQTLASELVDTELPSLSNVETDKQNYQAGETVNISITATDDVSGVRDVVARIKGPDGIELAGAGTYDTVSGKWIVKIPLNTSVQPGKWQILRVSLFDKVGHFVSYENGVDYTAEFNVENTSPVDTELPSLSNVEPDKQTYQAGETVSLNITATDDVSGVRDVVARIKGPDGTELAGSGTYDTVSGKWIVKIPLNTSVQPGKWQILRVSLFDKVGHFVSYENGVDYTAEFNVENTSPADTELPSLSNIETDKQNYQVGETVNISITATDDVSGVRDVVARIKGPDGIELANSGTYDAVSSKWVVKIPLNTSVPLGKWQVLRVALWDKAGHYVDYENGIEYTKEFFVDPKPKVQEINVTTDKPSPQDVATPITLTATSKGSSKPIYKFYVFEGNTGKVVQNYSEKNTFTWKPERAGTYRLSIHAKDINSEAAYDTYYSFWYKVQDGKVTQVNVTTDKPSPQGVATPITLTATSKGSSKPIYKFYVFEGSTGKVVQNYSEKNTFTWKPERAGTYRLSIHAKDINSQAAYDTYYSFWYKVQDGKVTQVNVTTDKPSPQGVATPITLTATSEGSSKPIYKFYVFEGSTGKVVQNYSEKNTFTWKPERAGTYRLSIHAKDINSEAAYDTYYSFWYKVQDGN